MPPNPRPRSWIADFADTAGGWFDRKMVDLALEVAHRPGRPRPDPAEQLRQLARATEAYDEPRFLDDPDTFFATPAPIDPRRTPVRSLPDGGSVDDLSVASAFVPTHEFPREAYLGHAENRTAVARHWRHRTPRATVICIHGYLGGALPFEEVAFEAPRLYQWGLDVLLPVLPFHGPRAPGGRRGTWPGTDPWRSIEGFAQAMFDLRAWNDWLHAEGASLTGTFGMSLGGYTAALFATIDRRHDFAALMIPLASMGDAYLQHRARRPEPPPPWVGPRIDRSLKVVSPFSRAPLLRPEQVLVLAAGNDGITPAGHAERLRDHFDAPMETFAGGHLLQVGRGRAFASLKRFLTGRRVIASR